MRDGNHLRVGGRIRELFALIVGAPDHSLLEGNDDRADRNLVLLPGRLRLFEGHLHMLEVKRMSGIGQGQVE